MNIKKRQGTIIIFLILLLLFLYFGNNIYLKSQKFYNNLPFKVKKYDFSNDEPVDGISKEVKIKENYRLNSKKNLRGLGILFATYGRKNEGNIDIKIYDTKTEKLLLNKKINQATIEDNKFLDFIFSEKQDNIENVRIELSSDSLESKSVTVWKSKKIGNSDNVLKINDKNTEGSLVIRELYKASFVDKTTFYIISLINLLLVSFIIERIIFNLRYILYFFKNFNVFVNDSKKYYNLLFEMVRRDIKVKYKRSVLGLMWSILNPLLMMIVMTIVFSTLFKSDIENFPIYLLAGQITFSFFSEATNMAMMSIITNGSLLKKVYIPKYIFPASKTIFALVNFLFSLIAVGIVAIFTKLTISIHIIALPLLILYVFLFSLGIGLILASYAVFFRDLVHLYGIFLLVWTYFTPIFYPIRIIPEKFIVFIKLNPMYHYINYFREILLYNRWPTLKMNIICLIFAGISLIVGAIIFYKNQNELVLNV